MKSLCFKTYLYDDLNIINFIFCATSQWVRIADDSVFPGQMECKVTKGVSGTKTILFKKRWCQSWFSPPQPQVSLYINSSSKKIQLAPGKLIKLTSCPYLCKRQYTQRRITSVALTQVGPDYWFWQHLVLRKAKSLSQTHRGRSGISSSIDK